MQEEQQDLPVDVDTSEPDARKRVLVVDDNVDIVRVIERILTKEGYAVETAHDGEAGLEAARKSQPDLMLLDVMMPKIDGLDVCRALKSNPETSGIMIILVTGRGSLGHLVEGLEAGADDYIPKPFHIPELVARTRSALRVKGLNDKLEAQNRQLILSQTQLVHKEKMATIGLLASGIAHEFNNIMAGICGYAQLAERSEKYRDKLVQVAKTQAQRAFEITNSLSTYNRASTGTTDSNVGEILDSALCLVTKELQRTGVQLTKRLEPNLQVKVSPGQLQEVVLNLLINAIQSIDGDRRGITVTASAADGDRVCIEVIDTGVGIDKESLSQIFAPFYTTKGALGGGSQGGTGLGLTVCYNVIQSHSGEITVDSTPGEGTAFRILLPRSRRTAPEQQVQTETTDTVQQDKPDRSRILVIDDEELTREILSAYLEDHDVVCCSNAEDGLETYAKRAFDYVILDICMQDGMNGFQAFDEFQSFSPPPKIIFASGCFPDGTYAEYLKRAHGHLLKPFQLDDLAALLALSTPEPHREAVAATE